MTKNDTFEILIEIPKGETRRLHIEWTRAHWLDMGHIKDVIPVNEGVMPIDYGFVIGTKVSEDVDKVDELDAVLYSNKKFSIGEKIKAAPIASIILENGDHKIVFVDDSVKVKIWEDIPEIKRKLFLEYFGYKSKVKSIGNKQDAIKLIKSCIADDPLTIPKEVIIRKDKDKVKK